MSDRSVDDEVSVGGAYIYGPGQSELRWMGDTSTYFLATGTQTAGTFCLVDERALQGESVPLHMHRNDFGKFVYVVEGEIAFFMGDQPAFRAKAGSFAHIPGGTVHGFRVESDTARYLILTTARHGEFYRAITKPSRTGGRPSLESVDGSTIQAACRKFGVEFVGALPDPT